MRRFNTIYHIHVLPEARNIGSKYKNQWFLNKDTNINIVTEQFLDWVELTDKKL